MRFKQGYVTLSSSILVLMCVPHRAHGQATHAEGAVTVVWPGGRVVPGIIASRVDAFSLAVQGADARLAINAAQRQPDDHDLTLYTAVVPLTTNAVGTAVPVPVSTLSAALVAHGAVAIGSFRPADRITVGARSAQADTFWFDEEVASSTVSGYVAAAVGMQMDCAASDSFMCGYPRNADDNRRDIDRMYDGRNGWVLSVVQEGPAGLVVSPVTRVPCGPATQSWRLDPAHGVIPPAPLPDTRCASARSHRPDDVAVAFHPTHTAVAWRADHMLSVAIVGPTGSVQGAPVVFSRGDVGAPAIAWHGEVLTAVWAQRSNATTPYALTFAEWPLGSSATVPHAQTLVTGTVSAFAPAIRWVGDRVVLTWMEGDNRTGAVRLAASWLGVAHVVDHAITVTPATRNARDPELGWDLDATQGWLVWSERAAGNPATGLDAEVHVSPVRLP